MRRRNAQSWDSLVARLRLDSITRRLGDQSVWNGDLNVTPEETVAAYSRRSRSLDDV